MVSLSLRRISNVLVILQTLNCPSPSLSDFLLVDDDRPGVDPSEQRVYGGREGVVGCTLRAEGFALYLRGRVEEKTQPEKTTCSLQEGEAEFEVDVCTSILLDSNLGVFIQLVPLEEKAQIWE